ncbi:MAG: hypothetical protein AB1765_06490 [Candidatus Hydrogenedentota bacterium]
MKKIFSGLLLNLIISSLLQGDDTRLVLTQVNRIYFDYPQAKFVGFLEDSSSLILYYKDNFKNEFYTADLNGRYKNTLLIENRKIVDYTIAKNRRYLVYRCTELDNRIKLIIFDIFKEIKSEYGEVELDYGLYTLPEDTDIVIAIIIANRYGYMKLERIDIKSDTKVLISDDDVTGISALKVSNNGELILLFNSQKEQWLTLKGNKIKPISILNKDIINPAFSKNGDGLLYVKNNIIGNTKCSELIRYDFNKDREDIILSSSDLRFFLKDYSITLFKEDHNIKDIYFILNKGFIEPTTITFNNFIENNLYRVSIKREAEEQLTQLNFTHRVTDFWISDDSKIMFYSVYDTFNQNIDERILYYYEIEDKKFYRILQSCLKNLWINKINSSYIVIVETADGYWFLKLSEKYFD